MDRGIYTSTSGGMVAERRIEIVSNNLANVNTAGFKGQRIVSRQQEFADTLASVIATTPNYAQSEHAYTPGVVDITAETDFSSGPINHTGNPLNVALGEADGFFVVQVGDEERYTRAGSFTLNANRELVTADGQHVLGADGIITLPATGKASISENGTVLAGEQVVSKLRVVKVTDKALLERIDGTRFKFSGDGETTEMPEYRLATESLEMPNVSTVSSMVELISASRTFEAYTKTVKTIDEINERVTKLVRG
ncbi:MAG: flagellar hook-basal body protein [Deltaproteobacteria bacterium]|jgi:flagellar basal-body rod protein FlgG|nr:flagellar hook-basal body protein [Deltaproteobacteria bacterium]